MIEENRTELSRDHYRFAPLSDVMTYGLNLSDGAYRTWAVLWRRRQRERAARRRNRRRR